MTIDSIFNETELAIFQRKTGFNFNDCYKSSDGIIFALDHQTRQIFVGNDLIRSNVFSLDSLASVSLENGQVRLRFNDSSSVLYDADEETAEAIMAELGDFQGAATNCPEADDSQDDGPTEEQPLTGEELNETYSRLANRGRDTALIYLVEETGMSVKEANEYLDELEKEGIGEPVTYSENNDRECHKDGTMTRTAIFETVRKLKPGDRIHIEFKPLIGKLRVYDVEYIKLKIDILSARYFSLNVSGPNFDSLMEDVAGELYDYIEICFFSEEKLSEFSLNLDRVTMLKIIS